MSAPLVETTALGPRTTYVFEGDLTRTDWAWMDALLTEAVQMGNPAIRLISNDATRVVITHTETA